MINEKKREKVMRGRSMIMHWLDSFAALVHRAARNGIIGRLMNNYTVENDTLKKSFSASAASRHSRVGEFIGKARFAIGDQFESSLLMRILRRCLSFLVGCRVRFYGAFLMTFGIYTALAYAIGVYIFRAGTDVSTLICGIVIAIGALPLMFSRRSLAEALISSRVGEYVFCEFFGIPAERFHTAPEKHGDAYNFAIIAGVVAGSLTFLIPPTEILIDALKLTVSVLVLMFPESGVVATVLMLPFLGSASVAGVAGNLISLFTTGYFIKLIRGKRVLHFDIYDLSMAMFAFVVLFAELVRGEGTVINSANGYVSLLVGCFVAANLMRTRQWLARCVSALTASATVSSLVFIWQKAANKVGELTFGDVTFRLFPKDVTLFFDDPDVYAAYLLTAFILTFCAIGTKKGFRHHIVGLLSSLSIAAATVLTGSFSGIAGTIIAFLFFAAVMSRKTIVVSVFTVFIGGSALLTLPAFITSRIGMFIGYLTGTASSAVKTWQGSAKLAAAALFGGTGFGGFAEFYPSFAVPGFESSADSSALWLQLLCETGIIGLLLFTATVFLFAQNCFEFSAKSGGGVPKKFVLASLSAVSGILAQSMFCNIFGDSRMLFGFFVLMSLTCAYIRICRAEYADAKTGAVMTEFSASVDL